MTMVEFDDDLLFVGSDVDVKLKTEFIKHKTSKTKVGESCIYWCKYGKKVGFACPVKVKTVRNNRKVLYMEEIDSKVHDHRENRQERIYENYTTDQVDAIKECIDLDLKPRFIKKSLKIKELVTDGSMTRSSSFYHKVNQIRKKICKDQVKISVSEFDKLLKDNSYFPNNADDAFVVKYFVDEHAREHADGLKYCVIISTQALMKRYLLQQDNDWCLLLDATYQTNMEGAPVILFGANTFNTGKQFLGIGVLISRYCNVLYCTVLYCTVLNCIALYCTVLYLFSDCRWYIMHLMEYAQFDIFSMSIVFESLLMELLIKYV